MREKNLNFSFFCIEKIEKTINISAQSIKNPTKASREEKLLVASIFELSIRANQASRPSQVTKSEKNTIRTHNKLIFHPIVMCDVLKRIFSPYTRAFFWRNRTIFLLCLDIARIFRS